MTRILFPRLRIDDDGLGVVEAVPGPDRDEWRAFEEAFMVELDEVRAEHGAVLDPDALALGGVAGAEAPTSWGLLRAGEVARATARRHQVVGHVREALECYTHDLFAGAGAVRRLRVLDTESHHGACRPILIETAHDGRWVLKRRPGAAEDLLLGSGGVFERLNSLAGGRLSLPRLEIRRSTHHPRLSWQRWVEPPTAREIGHGVSAATTCPAEAEPTWRRVGELAGAAAALGITDLGEENVVTRARTARAVGDEELELVPIDTELFLDTGLGLHRTMLTRDARVSANHHTGIEGVLRACTGTGPIVYLDEQDAIQVRRRSCRRTSGRSLLADGAGGVGYAASMTAFLRGVVEAWVVVASHRDEVAEMLAGAGPRRRLARPTAEYTDALAAWLSGAVEDPCAALVGAACSAQEAEQLRAGDVPYLLTETDAEAIEAWRERMTLSALGPVLRDAVEFVRGQVEPLTIDEHHGIHVALQDAAGHGAVGVDLPGSARRVVFTWDDQRVRLELPEPSSRDEQAGSQPDVGARLLRLQRTDAALRNAWAASEFTDHETHAKLARLTEAAVPWLHELIEAHGWPVPEVVGREASRAASQLVQHIEDAEVQQPLVQNMIEVGLRGRLPWSEVVGAADSLAVLRGEPQPFGTKFEKDATGLQPYRLAAPERIEEIRARAGLETLDEYRKRIERYVEALPTAEDRDR